MLMDSTFGVDVDPGVLAPSVGGRSGEGVYTVRCVGVCVIGG